MTTLRITIGFYNPEELVDAVFESILSMVRAKAKKYIGPTVAPEDFIRKVVSHPTLSEDAKQYFTTNMDEVDKLAWYFVTNESPVLSGELVAVESLDMDTLEAEVLPILTYDTMDDYEPIRIKFAHLTSVYPE